MAPCGTCILSPLFPALRCVWDELLSDHTPRQGSYSFLVLCRRSHRPCRAARPLASKALVGLGGDHRSAILSRRSVFQAVWVPATCSTILDFDIISLIRSVSPLVCASRSTMYMASTATLSSSGDLPQTSTTPF